MASRLNGKGVKDLFLGRKSVSGAAHHGKYLDIMDLMKGSLKKVTDLEALGKVGANFIREISCAKSLVN